MDSTNESTTIKGAILQRFRYMDVYMPHSSRVAIGQLRPWSHQLEIEVGRVAGIPITEQVCKICREEVENEEHFVCRCKGHQDIIGYMNYSSSSFSFRGKLVQTLAAFRLAEMTASQGHSYL